MSPYAGHRDFENPSPVRRNARKRHRRGQSELIGDAVRKRTIPLARGVNAS
ncbi:hypothetical protein STRTUCAR8_04388 [Streptomyces turgidiscabies Car8]|uniref:Uncharacterized protein n=1 Tax=Streptomyces turgidiscabies (strain Car8) TaxID=698760 RepID=L7FHR8_STRT8|nr:hypothetical protein STRTUCAR8_04388 [Streptomyces turgidiscabies Car8]